MPYYLPKCKLLQCIVKKREVLNTSVKNRTPKDTDLNMNVQD